ncbi:hypothetical protein NUACC26_032930 [Scytonema sp. NUACC26]
MGSRGARHCARTWLVDGRGARHCARTWLVVEQLTTNAYFLGVASPNLIKRAIAILTTKIIVILKAEPNPQF